jgi:hypothetical protein
MAAQGIDPAVARLRLTGAGMDAGEATHEAFAWPDDDDHAAIAACIIARSEGRADSATGPLRTGTDRARGLEVAARKARVDAAVEEALAKRAD